MKNTTKKAEILNNKNKKINSKRCFFIFGNF